MTEQGELSAGPCEAAQLLGMKARHWLLAKTFSEGLAFAFLFSRFLVSQIVNSGKADASHPSVGETIHHGPRVPLGNAKNARPGHSLPRPFSGIR